MSMALSRLWATHIALPGLTNVARLMAALLEGPRTATLSGLLMPSRPQGRTKTGVHYISASTKIVGTNKQSRPSNGMSMTSTLTNGPQLINNLFVNIAKTPHSALGSVNIVTNRLSR